MEELSTSLDKAKSGKAPGLDGLTAETLKHGGPRILQTLLSIINSVFEQQNPPDQWRQSVINPIPKKGNLSLMTNYRGISLMSVAAKLYNRMILLRIRPFVDPHLRDNQAGFRPDRSCIDQTHIIRRIIEGAEAHQLPLVITFIDFQKAFDSIDREMMFAILRHYGIPCKMVEAIKSIYNHSATCVRSRGGELSDSFPVYLGVMQGDTLAPYIFNIALDYPMKNATKHHGFITHKRRSTRFPERKLPDLDFADDIALLDDSITNAQQHLNDVTSECLKVGLRINDSKTKYTKYNIDTNTPLTTNGILLESTNNFTYLGSMTKNTECDIERRKVLGTAAYNKLHNIWNSHHIPTELKIEIFKVAVIPIFLYGCEAWNLTEASKHTINTFQTTTLRHILHIQQAYDHITNQELLHRAKTTPLTLQIEKRQLSKTGHRLRKPEHSLSNIYALYEPTHGHRKPGRPKPSFANNIATIIDPITKPTETQIRIHAANRDQWREIVKNHSTDNIQP